MQAEQPKTLGELKADAPTLTPIAGIRPRPADLYEANRKAEAERKAFWDRMRANAEQTK